MSSNDLLIRIENALNSVRPYLQADGGNVEVVEVDSDMNVLLKFTGMCSTCNMSEMTLKAGIEETLRNAIPNLGSVKAIS